MLISTHVLSGALVGRVLGRPLPALLLGAASHLALDRLPHQGRAGGWPPQPMQGGDFRVAAADGLCGLGLIALALHLTPAAARLPVLVGSWAPARQTWTSPGCAGGVARRGPKCSTASTPASRCDAERPELLRQDVVVASAAALLTMRLLRERRWDLPRRSRGRRSRCPAK